MKLITLLALLVLAPFSMALTEEQVVETLEAKLLFSGYVEVSEMKTSGYYTIVEFYVGSYGEERLTECVFKNDQLLDCKDNWFKL